MISKIALVLLTLLPVAYSACHAGASCGVCLRALSPSQCPSTSYVNAIANRHCRTSPFNTYCEGDGECGTNNNLNNCGSPKVFDVYYKTRVAINRPGRIPTSRYCHAGASCGVCLTAVPRTFCPQGIYLTRIVNSHCNRSPFNRFCEGDGECNTNPNLNNCGAYDVYYKRPRQSSRTIGACDNGLACGKCLEKVTRRCPSQGTLRAIANFHCNKVTRHGQLCEGDGECGTDPNLNNCGPFDVYKNLVCENRNTCGVCFRRVTRCPSQQYIQQYMHSRHCTAAIRPGQMCESDGHCGTRNIDNCGIWDVYYRADGISKKSDDEQQWMMTQVNFNMVYGAIAGVCVLVVAIVGLFVARRNRSAERVHLTSDQDAPAQE